jgi:hypothetical protein
MLTKRQFIEWPTARLAVELSGGLNIRGVDYYFSCRPLLHDKIFMDRLKLLVEKSDDFYYIAIMERKLPIWMSTEALKILLKKIPNVGDLMRYVRSVDNVLFILSVVDRCSISEVIEGIPWNRIRPLCRLSELSPWFTKEDPSRELDLLPGVIMGVTKDYYTVKYFREIKQILKHGNGGPGIWVICDLEYEYSTAKGLNKRVLEQIVDMGWIILYCMEESNRFDRNHIIDVLLEKKLSYFLFDPNTSCGIENRSKRWWLTGDEINDMVARDIKVNPDRYAIWLRHIKDM